MSSKRIYVIDDSVSVLIAVERMLHSHGFLVATERSGVAALETLRTSHPDLVICDLVLPDVDGREICALVRSRRELAMTPVIAISGLVDDQVRASAERAGAFLVLKKPFDACELRTAVDDAFAAIAKGGLADRITTEDPLPIEDPEVVATLDRLAAVPDFRFGLLLRMDGETVHRFGSGPPQVAVADGASALIEIAKRSTALTAWLGETDPHQLLFEASMGFVIAGRFGLHHLVVVAVGSKNGLGKTRLLLNRLRSRGAPAQPGCTRAHEVSRRTRGERARLETGPFDFATNQGVLR